jgi:hypothetical protein
MFDEPASMMLEPAIIHSTKKIFHFDSSAKKETVMFDQIEPIQVWQQPIQQQDPDSLLEFEHIEKILQTQHKESHQEGPSVMDELDALRQ